MTHKPKCPECGSSTRVQETRAGDGKPIYYHRVRKCTSKGCGALFTTVEIYAPDQSIPQALESLGDNTPLSASSPHTSSTGTPAQ